MNYRLVFTIVKKELVETLRDKTTLFINYCLPLLIWPLTAIWLGEFLAVEMEKIRNEERTVAIVGTEIPDITSQLEASKQLKTVRLSDLKRDKALAVVAPYFEKREATAQDDKISKKDPIWRFLRDEKIQALIAVKKEGEVGKLDNHKVMVFYDQTELKSMRTAKSLSEELVKVRTSVIEGRLKSRGLPWDFITPLILKDEDVGDTRTIGNIVGRIAPYFLLIVITLATYYTAIHTVVGERERGTMASLLSTPVGSRELMTGKFLNIVVNGSLSILIHAATSTLCIWLTPKGDVNLPRLYQPYFIPIAALSAVVFMSAVALFLTTVARTVREANGILSAFMIVVILPAAFVTLADLSLSFPTALIPLANVALVIKGVFIDPVNPWHILTLVISNVTCGIGIFALAAHVFRREAVLFRGDAGFADLFTLNRSVIKEATPGLSVLVFSVCLISSIYANFGLAKRSVFLTVPFTQFFVFLLVPALFTRYFRLDWKKVFLYKRPRVLSLFGAVVAAIGAALLMTSIISYFPAPKELMEEFAKKMGINDPAIGAATIVIVFGLLPGICEEITYRGILLSGFRNRLSNFWSILITAAMFGLNHFSLYRFIPTALGGVLLGWIACRTLSLFPAIVCHFLYNSTLLLLTKYPDRFTWLGITTKGVAPFMTAAAITAVSLGVALIIRSERSRA